MNPISGFFPGSTDERDALLRAVQGACACPTAGAASRRPADVCGAHRLLLNERQLKALIFYRRWRGALERGEWLLDPAWSGDRPPH